jgi:hypothetical protein
MHHTGKPGKSSDREGQTVADLAYSGLGSSEFTNFVREVAVLQRCQGTEPIYRFGNAVTQQSQHETAVANAYKPNFAERFFFRIVGKIAKFALSKAFGLQYQSLPQQSPDQHVELEISPAEAAAAALAA